MSMPSGASRMVSTVPIKCNSNAPKLEGAFYKKNSLDSESNGASSGLEMKRGHLGHYGYRNKRPTGPCQFFTAGNMPHINVF